MARQFVLKPDSGASAPRLTIDYAGLLNPQQFAAATATGGPVLVIAGAGSGKTRTLIFRLAYLVETGIPPEEIVLLTFTRRSASEMLQRAATLLDGRCSRVQGGTFHSFCLNILRRYADRIGFPHNFSILDAADAADVVDVLRNQRGLHKTERRFPRKRTLHAMFSTATNRGITLQQVITEGYPQFAEFLPALETLSEDYDDYKLRHGLMDYDDLLGHVLTLFDEHPDVARHVAAGCRHVLVDEYQDTNQLQADLVGHFAAVHHNVMAVGDDAQSIYRFRGANSGNIFSFPDSFPGTRVLKLEQNYRSTQPILNLANHLIGQARRKYEKELFATRGGGELPALVPAEDERTEARFVAQMVLNLREEGVPLNNMAVLFRGSHNSFELEVELNKRDIPFVKYGGIVLTEAAHVKDVMAYLRIIDNPRDAVAWTRILLLLEGVGSKTASDLVAWITRDETRPFSLDGYSLAPKLVDSVGGLLQMLRDVQASDATPADQAASVFAYYEPILERKYFEDHPKRHQDLEHFLNLTMGFRTRAELLSAMALDPVENTVIKTLPVQPDEAPLILSTIHSAKGLEFHSVFLIHALEGILPSSYSVGDAEALDEELRLFYVAVTRAENNLFVSYPIIQYRRAEGQFFSNPSRFVREVPEDILEPWQLSEEKPESLNALNGPDTALLTP